MLNRRKSMKFPSKWWRYPFWNEKTIYACSRVPSRRNVISFTIVGDELGPTFDACFDVIFPQENSKPNYDNYGL